MRHVGIYRDPMNVTSKPNRGYNGLSALIYRLSWVFEDFEVKLKATAVSEIIKGAIPVESFRFTVFQILEYISRMFCGTANVSRRVNGRRLRIGDYHCQ